MDNDFDTFDFNSYRIESVDICECGGTFIRGNDDELVCDTCFGVNETCVGEYMDRIDDQIKQSGLTTEQRKTLYKKLVSMNKNCIAAGIRPFDEKHITMTIDLFSKMREHTPKPRTRNKNRREQLGAYLYKVGKQLNNVRSKKEIQVFCGLPDRNITAASSELQIAINSGKLDLGYEEKDIRESFTRSICLKINIIDEEKITKLYEDVKYILDVVIDNILISSNFDSRTLGAVYIALRLNGYSDIQLQFLCKITLIHIETVQTFIEVIKANKHLFTVFEERFKPSS